MGIHQGVADSGLGGQVHNLAELTLRKQPCHRFPVCQVAPDKAEAVTTFQLFQTRLLQGHIIIVVQVVESDDLVAPLQQPAGQVKADKTCSAGNKYLSHTTSGYISSIFKVCGS